MGKTGKSDHQEIKMDKLTVLMNYLIKRSLLNQAKEDPWIGSVVNVLSIPRHIMVIRLK
jgi:hypothetical protein